MTQITGGVAKFGRTVKTGDFENKRADVEIYFGVSDGEDHNAALTSATALAVHHAHRMLGINGTAGEQCGKTGTGPAQPATVTGKSDKDVMAERVTGGAPGEVDGAGKPASGKGSRGPRKPPATEPAGDPAAMGEPVAEPKPTETPKAADPAAVVEDWSAAPAEITDADLTGEVTKHNAKIKNAPAIRALIGKYVAPPGQLREIAQEKRKAFLDELQKL